jgi:hypothetical protein
LPSSEWCMSSLLMPSEKRVPATRWRCNTCMHTHTGVAGHWSQRGQWVARATGRCSDRDEWQAIDPDRDSGIGLQAQQVIVCTGDSWSQIATGLWSKKKLFTVGSDRSLT